MMFCIMKKNHGYSSEFFFSIYLLTFFKIVGAEYGILNNYIPEIWIFFKSILIFNTSLFNNKQNAILTI